MRSELSRQPRSLLARTLVVSALVAIVVVAFVPRASADPSGPPDSEQTNVVTVEDDDGIEPVDCAKNADKPECKCAPIGAPCEGNQGANRVPESLACCSSKKLGDTFGPGFCVRDQGTLANGTKPAGVCKPCNGRWYYTLANSHGGQLTPYCPDARHCIVTCDDNGTTRCSTNVHLCEGSHTHVKVEKCEVKSGKVTPINSCTGVFCDGKPSSIGACSPYALAGSNPPALCTNGTQPGPWALFNTSGSACSGGSGSQDLLLDKKNNCPTSLAPPELGDPRPPSVPCPTPSAPVGNTCNGVPR